MPPDDQDKAEAVEDEPSSGPTTEYWSAREAAKQLGIKAATLYAYASRGLIESKPGPRGPARVYLRADVERLRARSKARRRGDPPGGALLNAGEPLLDSSITWLGEQGPLYRGHVAVELARAGTPFESVAELLWGGTLPVEPPRWPQVSLGLPLRSLTALVPENAHVLGVLSLATSALATNDLDRHDLRPQAVCMRARALVRRLAALVGLAFDPSRVTPALEEPSVARVLACALGLRPTSAVHGALDRMLVLLADHELNASTFAARVAASTHADPYACVSAGLAAASGPRHGGASEHVHALVQAIGRPERAAEVIRERVRLGERIPGFGHMVYRSADPRAEPLLEAARALAPRSRGVRIVDALVDAMAAAERPAINVDGALVSLACAIGIPPRATPAIFSIARVAGWIAHALEQYQSPASVLRPRARYKEKNLPES